MKADTIAEIWSTYLKMVIPENAPPVQRTECKRAFYGGCFSMLMMIKSISDAAETPEKGCEAIDKIDAELQQFRQDCKDGKE